jgi:hypothetical protein
VPGNEFRQQSQWSKPGSIKPATSGTGTIVLSPTVNNLAKMGMGAGNQWIHSGKLKDVRENLTKHSFEVQLFTKA